MCRKKKKVLNDKMSKDEILDVMRDDFDSNFKITLDRNVHKILERYSKTGETEDGAYGTFEQIGKSGQAYKFIVHRIESNVSENVYYGVATYFKFATEYGSVYYSVTQDKQGEFYDFDNDCCSVNRYTEHLITRYLERGSGQYYGERGFAKMIMENPYFDTKPIDNVPDGIFGVTSRGSIIGKVVKGKNCFNTFYNKAMTEYGKFSNIYIDIELQQKYLFADIDIKAAADRYRLHKISAAKYASIVDTALAKVDDGFYEYANKTKSEILEDVRKAIEEDALRSTESGRDAHLTGRPQKLCVCSCIQRAQTGV